MSLDRSLKSRNALVRHRNVLTRAERLEKLEEEERWDDSQSVFKLPKVAHRKSSAGHKDKKKEEEKVEGEEAAEAEGTPTAGEDQEKKA